jgi:hypothetical protein
MNTPQPTDLSQICENLQRSFLSAQPRGYVNGKTAIRDTIMSQRACSAAAAERLVDRMEALGYLHYRGKRHRLDSGQHTWAIHPNPNWIG